VRAPASPYVLQAGNVIPAAMVTGLRSDLPGQVVAQVTENVYDSPTGRFLLIPQGSCLVGQYDAQVSFGQSRVLLVWSRLLLPNGRSIVLERQPGADGAGYAGLEDGVAPRPRRLFGSAPARTGRRSSRRSSSRRCSRGSWRPIGRSPGPARGGEADALTWCDAGPSRLRIRLSRRFPIVRRS
jgi:hypothetical protein